MKKSESIEVSQNTLGLYNCTLGLLRNEKGHKNSRLIIKPASYIKNKVRSIGYEVLSDCYIKVLRLYDSRSYTLSFRTSSIAGIEYAAPKRETAIADALAARSKDSSTLRPCTTPARK